MLQTSLDMFSIDSWMMSIFQHFAEAISVSDPTAEVLKGSLDLHGRASGVDDRMNTGEGKTDRE